ncbi:MAG: hypothetical protein ACRDY6_07535 [Acidimicrobiia bacterium]
MKPGGFSLELQLLGSANDQVLVVGQLAGYRTGDRRFSRAQLDELFDELRVPRPANTSTSLARLRARGLVTRMRGDNRWALTPLGDAQAVELVGQLDPIRVEVELADVPGAEFARTIHRLIPPALAPHRWRPGIGRLLERSPFEENVFCMTRFPGTDEEVAGPIASAIRVARGTLGELGLALHVASDQQLDDDVFGNVGAYLWACQYGVGILEARGDEKLNHNVIIELGSMIITGRRCAILLDRTIDRLPADLAGQIYKRVDLDEPDGVSAALRSWVQDDLRLSP